MRQYAVTSSNFIGEVYYTFDDLGALVAMELKGITEPAIHAKLCATVPHNEGTLMAWKTTPGTKMQIAEVNPDLTFENFWNRYNNKKGIEEARRNWERLTRAEKIKALANIPLYDKHLSGTTTPKMYPATYLSPKNKRFNDEYK